MRNKFQFFASLLVLSTLGFTACSDSDDDTDESEFKASAIVGVWDIDAMTTTVVTSEGTETDVQEPDAWMDFKEDGTGLASNDISFTWSLSGSSLLLAFDQPDADGLPIGGGPGTEFNFSFEDLAAFEEIALTVTDLEESYLSVEYAANYGTMSVSMVMELSR